MKKNTYIFVEEKLDCLKLLGPRFKVIYLNGKIKFNLRTKFISC